MILSVQTVSHRYRLLGRMVTRMQVLAVAEQSFTMDCDWLPEYGFYRPMWRGGVWE